MRRAAQSFAGRWGLRIVRSPESRLVRAMERLGVDTVIDAGANEGEFHDDLRRNGFGGPVISFEPNPFAYSKLLESSARDPQWQVMPIALGEREGTAPFTLCRNAKFSSLLRPRKVSARFDAGCEPVESVEVSVLRLESLGERLGLGGRRILLKTDCQGSDLDVLKGAAGLFDSIMMMRIELAFEPTYECQPRADVVIPWLRERGYHLSFVSEAFRDLDRDLVLEMDAVFLKPDS